MIIKCSKKSNVIFRSAVWLWICVAHTFLFCSHTVTHPSYWSPYYSQHGFADCIQHLLAVKVNMALLVVCCMCMLMFWCRDVIGFFVCDYLNLQPPQITMTSLCMLGNVCSDDSGKKRGKKAGSNYG